ncbi:MAG: glycoside hydrolase family 95 protein [Bacteroidales bacterium]|nr:glycoside hydrolase family 95 protein [Bacteroidales bacterium]
MTIRHLFSLLLSVAVIPIAAFGHPTTLLYDAPAKEWMQSLPIGNGRLGLNVFGDPHCETLWLNEATLWSGQPDPNQDPEFGKEMRPLPSNLAIQ